MASKGNTALDKGIPQLTDAFVVIVKTEWNVRITDELEAGCKRMLEMNRIASETYIVPGAFEIPFAIKTIYSAPGKTPNAFVAFAAVIKGDTPHFDYVCNGITNGITQLNLTLDVPTIFGVLTVNNEEQALERIGGVHGHKGEEAAITAIKMIAFYRGLYQ